MSKKSASKHDLIVIADDDFDVCALLQHQLKSWGYRTVIAGSKSELMATLSQERPVLVLLDLKFGDIDGLDLLRQLLDSAPDLTVALLTAHGSIDVAVSAMRIGAYDFLTKPPDPNRLRILIGHAFEKERISDRLKKLESIVSTIPAGLQILGESPSIQSAISLMRNVAPTDATVLILGESGTGKELAARTIHEMSRRKDGPFIPLNMAALPKELAESLLFGHEKGAFTGADRAQNGACELADKGTLFLDEMGEMDLGLQAKLLRFLQDRTVQRVGNPKAITVDVRVVAATNRDLFERVRAGHFREDLYYRLNVVPVRLPALRERKIDIPTLAATFLTRAVTKYHRDDMSFTPEAIVELSQFDWPGNVRQLENTVERAVILSSGPIIGPEVFRDEFRASHSAGNPIIESRLSATAAPPAEAVLPGPQPPSDPSLRFVDQMEKQAIIDSLATHKGSVRDAAHALGLSQATVYRKLKRYMINLDDFSGGTSRDVPS